VGAIFRVRVHYVNLKHFITSNKKSIPVYGTFLEAQSMYDFKVTKPGYKLLLGSESDGSNRLKYPQ